MSNFTPSIRRGEAQAWHTPVHVAFTVTKHSSDPILEDPIAGGYDQLVMDIYSIVKSGGDLCTNNPCMTPAMTPIASISVCQLLSDNLHKGGA